MDIKKILWPTDGSKESEESLKAALYLARIYGAGIICLHVSEIHIPVTELYPTYEGVVMDVVEKTEQRFNKDFARIEKENPGVSFSSRVVRGCIVDWIIETARDEGAELIIMGKKGRGLIGSALLGSNTLKALRNSPVPVLSVKPEPGNREFGIKKILVPFDISDKADSSLLYSIGLAGKLAASLTVVYVFWIDANVYELSPELVDELTAHSATELSRRVEEIADKYRTGSTGAPDVGIETKILTGVSPALTITDYANENDFDLISVSTHGRKGFERMILGSETEKIIREARCPVLALKP